MQDPTDILTVGTELQDSTQCYYCSASKEVDADTIGLKWTHPFQQLESVTSVIVAPRLQGEPRDTGVKSSVFAVLLLMVVSYLLIYRLAPSRFLLTLLAPFNQKAVREQARDDANISLYYQLSMLLLALVAMGIFATELMFYQLKNSGELPHYPYWIVVLLFVIGLAIWLGSKVILINVAGTLFNVQMVLKEYTAVLFHYTYSLGLLLTMAIAGLYFFEWPAALSSSAVHHEVFLYVGLGLLAILFVLRILKTIYFGTVKYSISLFYNILYLCTLEILPLLIVARWVTYSFFS